jgi:hypothetical protein
MCPIAEHYHDQAARLRIMAVVLPGAELKAKLRAAARMYEDLAEKAAPANGDKSEAAQTRKIA